MPIRLLPDNTRFRFMRLRGIIFPLTVVLSVLSVALFIFVGPNYGIDFRGGSIIEVHPEQQPPDIGGIRAVVGDLGLGDVQIQEVNDPDGGANVLIRIEQQEGGDEAQQAAVERVRGALGAGIEIRRIEIVGPRVSGELAYNGTIATLITLAAIMIYVWFRFEWQFSVGAIIATLHDVLLTLGFYAVVDLEFNLSSIAAILTIVGFSLNDTVVIYDRVREILRKYKKMPISDVIDRAVNETLGRTIITAGTTLIVLLALYIFGGDVIRSFVGAMIFGVFIGTYSSVYIAGPILIYFKLRSDKTAAADETTAEPAGTG